MGVQWVPTIRWVVALSFIAPKGIIKFRLHGERGILIYFCNTF